MGAVVKWFLIIIILIILILILLWIFGGVTPAGGGEIFVSSASYDGNFGAGQVTLGHLVADSRCQELADRAGLSGTYMAWISGRVDTGAGPLNHGVVDRFNQLSTPYRLVDGTQVADNWADLADGTLDHAINIDENGVNVADGTRVWTNTTTGGAAWDNSRNCAQGPSPDTPGQIAAWSCGSPSWSPGDCQFQSGKYGIASSTTGSWTGTGSSNNACSNEYRLYCVKQ